MRAWTGSLCTLAVVAITGCGDSDLDLSSPASAITSELTIGQADVVLTSYGPAEGQCGVTACYAVTGKRRPEVSHFVVGTPSNCSGHLVGATVDGVAHAAAVGVHTQAGCSVEGVKFDFGIKAGQTVNVCLTYDQNFALGEVELAVKAGPQCVEGKVAGPTCNADEICDGVDQDCDGSVDEEIPGTGESCAEGTGACRDEGTTVCDAASGGIVCDATPGAPSAELCGTDVDEDCDGETDEGFDDGDACTDGLGACLAEGVKVCSDDKLFTVCDAVPGTPTPELCGSGVDEDCDGETDEGFSVGLACNAGIGECNSAGETVCAADGLATECNAVPGVPSTELCGTGKDEDCDGATDEGFDVGDSCSVGVGACAATGNKICAADGSGTLCDVVEGTPGTELCGNAVDDDCDGATDEGFEAVGASCSVGLGECADAGYVVCAPDLLHLECDAVEGSPTDEICDGLDNDCNGASDDGITPDGFTAQPPVQISSGEITLKSFTYDVEANTTTACYDVQSVDSPAVSHIIEGTVGSCDDALLEVTVDGAAVGSNPSDHHQASAGCEPIHGVKVDNGFGSGEVRELCLVYDGLRELGVVPFQVKAGTECETGEVGGVGCAEVEVCALQ